MNWQSSRDDVFSKLQLVRTDKISFVAGTFCHFVPAFPTFPSLTQTDKMKKLVDVKCWLRVASDWGCVLICGSYAPGLGQTGTPRSGDMEYADMISQSDLSTIDENLNLEQISNFGFPDFIQSYGVRPQ